VMWARGDLREDQDVGVDGFHGILPPGADGVEKAINARP
jgi:hypothetical protein